MPLISPTDIEYHPLQPFLPIGAKVLLLGSFPPKHERWSMEFFYPNFQNDMWRIMGLIFFKDKNYFIIQGEKKFAYTRIVDFCTEKRIAIFDTAQAVKRLKDNAADQFLEIIQSTDINRLLTQLPQCKAIITTGQKASEIVSQTMLCTPPKVGEYSPITTHTYPIRFYRMPSSSRAYPLAIEKKAAHYQAMFKALKML